MSTTAALPVDGSAEYSLILLYWAKDVTLRKREAVECSLLQLLLLLSYLWCCFEACHFPFVCYLEVLLGSIPSYGCLMRALRLTLPFNHLNVSSYRRVSHACLKHSRSIEQRLYSLLNHQSRAYGVKTVAQIDFNMPNPLIRFYDPEVRAKDPKGRTVAAILTWDDQKLETAHDYIQILFPLPEGSPFNSWAPVIDRTTFNAFRQRPALRDNLRRSFERMLEFYGFTLEKYNGKVEVCESPNFPEASQNWVAKYDHNHLRMTRIIRSLRVLGLEPEAQAFFAALKKVYEENPRQISEKSLKFWTRAADRPLYLAPEDDADEGEGQDYLYEVEGVSSSSSGEEEESEEEEEEDDDEESEDESESEAKRQKK